MSLFASLVAKIE